MEKWDHKGFWGVGGNIGPLLSDSGKGVAIVCGGARGVFDEFKLVDAVYPNAKVFAVNDTGMYLPRFDHWASIHYEKLEHWVAVRKSDRQNYCSEFEEFIEGRKPWVTHSIMGKYDYIWAALEPMYALSGFFAMQLAYLMGFDKIILCGCPGERVPRFFDPEGGKKWETAEQSYTDAGITEQLETDARYRPELKKMVRSMSGFTKQFFGAPEEIKKEAIHEFAKTV